MNTFKLNPHVHEHRYILLHIHMYLKAFDKNVASEKRAGSKEPTV